MPTSSWDTEGFVGTLRAQSGLESGVLNAVHQAPGRPPEHWKGMSGAGLFAEGLLIGIVTDESIDTASLLSAYRCLTRHLWVLGVELADPRLYPELAADSFPVVSGGDGAREQALGGVIDSLLAQRQQARKDKDFAKADLIRDLLAAAGVSIEDTPKGPRWDVRE
ncbi:hypothetical protein G6O69_37135 [Pseudenhygromyxa sp. WMMC2535]|uniref:CysS/YqeB C-terminal domain-containing protein n=1 Tax=Pseudenhygromyxa sp. WMMC2535 TaxID=2712867 RepID=UPI001594EDAE|nr:hypothetical protein [Pseudenhygromyxa sp. WMMC2535]NVB40311.1 hypothetical protein [Pseudenhygromyxa sp. WMMC2535]NVB43504.1 hypothetical protein [Pseudenhygromyxa sp. WMMC2535]